MKMTTGGKPRKQMTDKEQIEHLKKLGSLIEQENIKLREQVKNLSEATVKREKECDCPESDRMHMMDDEDDECTICGKKF